MMRRKWRKISSKISFIIMVFCIHMGFAPQEAAATTIDSLTFGELVYGCDVVVTAKCIKSGGITAKYEVLKKYKGELDKGDTFILHVPTDPFGPVFPIRNLPVPFLLYQG